ncbi:putative transcription-associated protein [Dirofilaria immitis]
MHRYERSSVFQLVVILERITAFFQIDGLTMSSTDDKYCCVHPCYKQFRSCARGKIISNVPSVLQLKKFAQYLSQR